MEDFSAWLRVALARKNMSQKQLAAKVGAGTYTVSKWVRGLQEPSEKRMSDIRRALDTVPDVKPYAEPRQNRTRTEILDSNRRDALTWRHLRELRASMRVGSRYRLPARSYGHGTDDVTYVQRMEPMTLEAVYPHVAVFRRRCGLRECYTWPELAVMERQVITPRELK